MAFKTVTAVTSDLDVDKFAIQAAIALAASEGGHLGALCLGVDRTQAGLYYAGASAVAIESNFALAEADAKLLETGVQELLAGSQVSWTTRVLVTQMPGLSQFLAQRMIYSDIAVLALPYGVGRDHVNEVIVEAALFDAKIPVLVIPDNGKLPDPINRIVIAWNESPEALSAVRLALPLLGAADVVNIAMVNPPTHALDRSDPGGALAKMLSRHGIPAEVSILAKTMPRVSDVIARHVVDQNADLLVMGAYGHSRIRESILGGATRHTLEMTKLPVFMAH